MNVRGGGKKIKSLIFNYHPIFSSSPDPPESKDIRMSSEDQWEVPSKSLENGYILAPDPKFKKLRALSFLKL